MELQRIHVDPGKIAQIIAMGIVLIAPVPFIAAAQATSSAPSYCNTSTSTTGYFVTTDMPSYLQGQPINICLTENGQTPLALTGTHPWQITDQSGDLVFAPATGTLATSTGTTFFTDTWNGQNASSTNVDPGMYEVVFPGFPASPFATFLITSSSTATTTTSTTTPVISNITATPTTTSATIAWTTDQPASSQVQYGTSASLGTYSALMDTTTPLTSHSIALSNLTPGTTYSFDVMSGNGSATTTSPIQTFMTGTTSSTVPDGTPPTLAALIAALQQLQNLFPNFSGQIQGIINQLLGSGTTIGNTASATIDQNGQSFKAGTSIDFGGRNFGHEETVTVTQGGQTVATAHADGGGNFSTGSLPLPSTPGTYTYTFTGASSGITVQATITLM